MRQFLDVEAELGSDREENDDAKAKSIDMNDIEEDEDGMDSDLSGFVDREPL